MLVTESAIVGVVATIIGLIGGFALFQYFKRSLVNILWGTLHAYLQRIYIAHQADAIPNSLPDLSNVCLLSPV